MQSSDRLLNRSPKSPGVLMNRGPLLVSILCLASGASHAEDLLAVYDRALVNDPQIREADATRLAAREARPQAWGTMLPQVSASAMVG